MTNQSRATTRPVQQLHIDHVSNFENITESWRELIARDRHATFFSQPEWLATWWKHFGGGNELVLLAVVDEGRMVGLAPLMIMRRHSVSTLRFIGTGLSDYGDILADDIDGRRLDVVWAVLDHLAIKYPRALVDLHQIPETSPTLESVRQWARDHRRRLNGYVQAECSYFDLPAEEEEFEAQRSRNDRQQERRKYRRLAKRGDVSLYDAMVPDGGDWSKICGELADVERDRAADKGHALQWSGQRGAFLRDVLEATAETGQHWLMGLRIDARLIGFNLVFVDRRTCYGYIDGFDSRYAEGSPGNILKLRTVRLGIDHGKIRLDHLRGQEEHKKKLTTGRRRNYRLQFALANSLHSRFVFTAREISAAARVRARSSSSIVRLREAARRWSSDR